jgi:phenylalanyl-tRNA synthetase beta chain
MKISELWLREWVNPPLSTKELLAQLTMAGLEVDNAASVSGVFTHVVVAKVLETSRHPEADKLTLCQVDCGRPELVKIVCGASNVRPGLTVALAMIGATLPNGMTIKSTKLRGELSQGMLCSSTELGMTEQSEGILELPDDAPIGQDLREYMTLNDVVIDVDLTPNRADCFSILGIAREVAALNQVPLRELPKLIHEPQHDEVLTVNLDAVHACPQYYGRIIRHIRQDAQTPLWLKERLRRAGVRAVHPVVDVMNYVMIELGQPLHAFDKQTLEGEIHVRLSTPSEKLTLLDEQTVTLKPQTLVIADSKKPLALAGIMGGLQSAVNEETTSIFVESAFFTPQHIAGVARQYGLTTDASQRYERGVDPHLQLIALEYATSLLLTIVGGEPGPVITAQAMTALPLQKTVSFEPAQVQRLTGVDMDENAMLATLKALGMGVDNQTKPWTVAVPSHRFDIELDVDLVEELIRIYGYDRLPTLAMHDTLQPGLVHPLESLSNRLARLLQARGYHETIHYSFVDPALQQAMFPDAQALALLNPISSELSNMRLSLWPGLIASYIYNSHRQQFLVKLFETGSVFDTTTTPHVERACIAGLIAGELGALSWGEPAKKLDFFDLKGDLQALLAAGAGFTQVQFVKATHHGLHPGKTAQVFASETPIGWIGELHPRLMDALELDDDVLLFEISLPELLKTNSVSYQKISKFPSVRRDLSFLIDDEITALQIETCVRGVINQAQLKSFDVFDVYVGESIPQGKKSLAIALTLQERDRTLTDEEVNALMDNVVKNLIGDFTIILRDSS